MQFIGCSRWLRPERIIKRRRARTGLLEKAFADLVRVGDGAEVANDLLLRAISLPESAATERIASHRVGIGGLAMMVVKPTPSSLLHSEAVIVRPFKVIGLAIEEF
ncbi:hypothetical protein ATE69_18635 [Sphingopyxis sp. H071]|nr:hypothetical protein ATE61_17840 [Sphingopyxis sp. H057]KTE48488.1 hypothetical protein ATE64_20680 [Sphingopyxis sp. H073]KTE50087.1 hypothetical protein ATE69_18635 [Sphingopyxis sp. H071]KTE58506.1 hypothetical protein ATE66_15105 [Sphingopyxis sp. H107]KTE63205.1 hypothetical protein ATE65_16230 [Sphingopyxis sp. H100]KTE70458.1 hypothetical protein ATE60_15320 [Sphingopyxis sp. H081]KTE77308.1 hypothetical protein ATE63_17910 [Sphingopyxis sp. H067]